MTTMTMPTWTLHCIDHIEVYVPDREVAVAWYQQVLGLDILRGPVWAWAAGLPEGPLFLANPSGSVKVSLFTGEPQGDHPACGQIQTCFSVDGPSFLRFMEHLDTLALSNRYGERVTREQLSDHKVAWAFYFTDPYGNRYELNTYDYAVVQAALHGAEPSQHGR